MKSKTWYTIAGVIIGIYGIIRLIHILTPDPINDDLLDYVNNHLVAAEKIKMAALDTYNNVVGTHYTNDETMYDSLKNTVVPKYKEFDEALRAIKPATKEVMNLHNRYIMIADTELSGFSLLLTALKTSDSVLVSESDRKIQKADKDMVAFDVTLDSLAEKHDVEITRKNTK